MIKKNEKSIVHVANTNFEFELSHPSSLNLEQSLILHPSCLQLQFLPLLYAAPHDLVAVSALPTTAYFLLLEQMGWWPKGLPRLILLQTNQSLKGLTCHSWGYSRQVQAWAQARGLHYEIPKDWATICQVNSKAFSLRYSNLPGAALLANEKELKIWLQEIEGPKVLKTCFGLSGKGHFPFKEIVPSPALLAFCYKEWQEGRALIGEPWLDKLFDFSTQWEIGKKKEITFLGATRFETNAKGIYQATLAGPEEQLFDEQVDFLLAHKQVALQALRDMANLGFFGAVGVDALVYRCRNTHLPCLYPLVEINARQTMSSAILRLQQRLCPQKVLRLSYVAHSSGKPLLPSALMNAKGQLVSFRRNLFWQADA